MKRSLFLVFLGQVIAAGQQLSLKGTELLPEVRVPPNTELRLLADFQKQRLTSPTALTPMENGDWLVAETHRFMAERGIDDNRQRHHWLLEDLASRSTADRLAMYQRWYHKHPAEHYTRHAEKIRLIEDRDRDGQADGARIWADGFNQPLDGTAAGVFSFNGRTYFACIPHIWLLEDRDGDGQADSQTSLQDGFGVRVSFSGHDLNGFAVGPDGRLYATIGDRGFNLTTREGKTYEYPGQGAVFRFDFDGSNFEVVHTGLRNPKEIAFDEFGNGITVDNNSDQGDKARIVDITLGADSGWRMGHQVMHNFYRNIGLKEYPISRWMAEKMWQPANAEQPAWLFPPLQNYTDGPSGLTYDPGTGFAPLGRRRFYICDYRGGAAISRVASFRVEDDGAGLKVVDNADLIQGTAATDVEFGYDGRLYVADFMGGWSAHDAGRIFSIGPRNPAELKPIASLISEGIYQQGTEQLAEWLNHPDQRVRLRAQIALADRSDALEKFSEASAPERPLLERLHGTWGLWILARQKQNPAATRLLSKLLKDSNPRVRAQAARAFGEAIGASPEPLADLLRDRSKRVRFFAALSLSRIGTLAQAPALFQAIVENQDDAPHLRHAYSFALSRLITEETLGSLLEMSADDASKRLSMVIALRRIKHKALSHYLDDPEPRIVDEAIRAIHDQQLIAQQAAIVAKVPLFLNPEARRLSRMMQHRLVHSIFRTGNDNAIELPALLVHIACAEHWHFAERIEALRLLKDWEKPHPVDQSLGRFSPLPKRTLSAKQKRELEKIIPNLIESETRFIAPALAIIRQYQLKADCISEQKLVGFIENLTLTAEVRAQALESLLTWDFPQPNAQVRALASRLSDFANDPADAVAITALKLLAARDPHGAVIMAEMLTNNPAQSNARRQAAWRLAGEIDTPAATELIKRGLSQLQSAETPPPCALEMVEAARRQKDPQIQSSLADYLKSLQKKDPLGEWMLAQQGGDPESGRKLFRSHPSAQCMRCHSVGVGDEASPTAGPNLNGVGGRGDARYFLESMIHPSAKVVPGYGGLTLFFENGGFLSGILEGEDATHVLLRSGEELWKVKRKDILKQSGPISSMPAMGDLLQPSEARDIVAYLQTLSDKSKPRSQVKTAKTFNPVDAKIDEPLLGSMVYQNVCASCHGNLGEGISPNPPLAGSEWLQLDSANLIRLQLHGLTGPIDVKAKRYQLAMPSNAALSDIELAAVINHVRYNFAQISTKISASQVAELRNEQRDRPWTAAELLAKSSPETQRLIKLGPRAAKATLVSPPEKSGTTGPGHGVYIAVLWFLLSIGGAFVKTKGH